jgi:hypothetical protein
MANRKIKVGIDFNCFGPITKIIPINKDWKIVEITGDGFEVCTFAGHKYLAFFYKGNTDSEIYLSYDELFIGMVAYQHEGLYHKQNKIDFHIMRLLRNDDKVIYRDKETWQIEESK